VTDTQMLVAGLCLLAVATAGLLFIPPRWLIRVAPKWLVGEAVAHVAETKRKWERFWLIAVCGQALGLMMAGYSNFVSVTPGSVELHYQNLNLFNAPYNLYLGNGSDSDVTEIGYLVRDPATGRRVAAGVFDGLSQSTVRYLPVGYAGGPPPQRVELCLSHKGPWPMQRTAVLFPLEHPNPSATYYQLSGMTRTANRFFGELDCDEAFRPKS